jgi:hypothetical protein
MNHVCYYSTFCPILTDIYSISAFFIQRHLLSKHYVVGIMLEI